ncbi:histidine-rich glycoprotein [Opisthocomus hoazin]|uniref:histidine-rich glycoprotein n=1 Tax=Opisthocomus hoazin TaxID=30419 RepID=UPI003F5322D2
MLLLASAFFLTLLQCSNAQNKTSITPADCNAIERYAGAALDLVNRHRRDGYVFGLFRVADAHELHIGNSSVLYLTLDVVETECPVLSRRHWRSCEYSDIYSMDFGQCKIITSHLLKKPQLYGFNCTLSPVPPDLLECKDCPVKVEVLEVTEQHKSIAAKALEKFNSEGNHTNYFNVDKVEKILKMTASREGHILGFSIKETNCSKPAQQEEQALECDFLDDWHAHVGFCKARIISDSDEPDGTDISCEIYHPWLYDYGQRCKYSALGQPHRHPHHHFGHRHHHRHGCPPSSQSRPEDPDHNHSFNEERQDGHEETAPPPLPNTGPHHHPHPPHHCPPPPPQGPHHHHPPPHHGSHCPPPPPHGPHHHHPPPHHGPHCPPPPPHGPHHHHPPPPHHGPHPPPQEEPQHSPSAPSPLDEPHHPPPSQEEKILHLPSPPPPHDETHNPPLGPQHGPHGPPPPPHGPHHHHPPPHHGPHCPPPPPHGPHHHHPPPHHGPHCPPPPPHGPHHHHPPPHHGPHCPPPPPHGPHHHHPPPHHGPHCPPPPPHGPHHHHPPPHHGPHCPPPHPHGPHDHHPPPHHGPHCPPPPHGPHHQHPPPPHHGPHHPPPPGHPPFLYHHYYRHHCNKTSILGKYFPFQVTGAVYRIPVLNQQDTLTAPSANFPELSQNSPHSFGTGEGIPFTGSSLKETPAAPGFPDHPTQSKSCPGNPILVLPKILPLFPHSSMAENSPT